MLRTISILLLFIFLLVNCATPGSPSGGPKDTQAPRIDSIKTTPNYQTNFSKQQIELTFDEWIKLNDVFNQVIVSPPLEKELDIRLKGKTVRINFDEDEVLRENVTYTLNFGESIQDLTESNPVTDMRFVFSTGNFIDSLQVKGVVKDVLNNEGVENIRVMLYENTADSVVRTERPFYFAKTDTIGRFKISNVKAGTFKVFALEDSNLNYIFDQESERIGFLDRLISVSDSQKATIPLQIFAEEPLIRLMDDDLIHYGLIELSFNRVPYDVDLRYKNLEKKPYLEYDKNDISIWYDSESPWDLYLQSDTVFYDTIRIESDRAAFLKETTLEHLNGSERSKSLHVLKAMGIEFNHPITLLDTSLIRLYEDSLRLPVVPQIYVDSSDQQLLRVNYKWKEAMLYELEVFPNAVTDIFGLKNDTIVQSYSVSKLENFGTLNLTIDSLQINTQYIVHLLNKDNLVEKIVVKNKTQFQKRFIGLVPAAYSIKIIEDRNGNGRWDTGNYDLKRQAERIFKKPIESLRANWEIDATIVFD